MKLDPAAYHDICNLTMNVAVSRAEAETWKKCLLVTADEKIKMQKSQLTVNLLRKLKKRGVGVNSVECFCIVMIPNISPTRENNCSWWYLFFLLHKSVKRKKTKQTH